MRGLSRGLKPFSKAGLVMVSIFALVAQPMSAVLFAQTASAEGEGATLTISTVSELRAAIKNQDDRQTWTITPGNYGLSQFDDIFEEGQTGWYFPITADNLTIKGVGNPTLYGTGYSVNGNWSTQNFISVFGDNVTIEGLTLMPKVEPNKTIEVLGSNFTLRNTVITPNTLTNQSDYDSVSDAQDAKQWGGSLYFSHAGNHVVENVTINNAGVSFRYAPAGTHISFSNVKVVDATNVDWINGYRFSSGFNSVGNTTTGLPSVEYHVSSSLGNLASVLAKLQDGDTVKLDSDLTVSQQLTLTKDVTFDGNGYKLKPSFTRTDNDNNAAMGILSDNVTVNNLIIDGIDGTTLHGINVYQSHGVALNDVSVKNNDRTGIVVNGSTVTVSNVSTENNGWHGINVDKTDAVLTVNGSSKHNEMLPIYVDASSVGQVVDTNNQYVLKDTVLKPGDRVYTLQLAAPTIVSPENNSYTANPSFDNVFTKVAGGVKYGYETTYYNGASSYIDTSDSGNYDLSGTNVVRHNNGAPEATYKWRVRAIDASGIPGAWSEYSYVTVDKTAPSTPVHSSPSSAAFINNNDFWFNWNDVDGVIGYEIQNSTNPAVDSNGSFQNVMWTGDYQRIQPTESQAHSVGASGTWYWQVRAIDAADNKSLWSSPWKVTIDMTAPAAPTLSSPANGSFVDGAIVTQSWSANGSSDVNHYVYESYYDADATNLRWSESFTGLSKSATNVGNTSYWWRVKAVDSAGNVSAWSPLWKLNIDNDAPVVAINPVVASTDTTPTVTGKTSEHGGDVTLLLNGIMAARVTSDLSGNWEWTPATALAAGLHTIVATATDAAGHTSSADTSTAQNYWKQFTVQSPAIAVANTLAGTVTVAAQTITPTLTTAVVATTDGTDTLGVQDGQAATNDVATIDSADDAANQVSAAGASDTKDANNGVWSILGFAWYWWLLLVAAVVALWWLIATLRLRKDEA